MDNQQAPQAETQEASQAAPPETVDSGLISLAVPAARPVAEAASAEAPPNTAPIQIADDTPPPQVAKDFAVSDEKPADFVEPVIDAASMEKLQAEAKRDDVKRDFTLKILEARKPKPEPQVEPPPLAPRVVEQTNAELAAGRAMVAKNEELAAARRPRVPEPTDGKVTPVFRPGDYVPDQKKGQGNVQARTL